jgi:hypothetical protein
MIKDARTRIAIVLFAIVIGAIAIWWGFFNEEPKYLEKQEITN